MTIKRVKLTPSGNRFVHFGGNRIAELIPHGGHCEVRLFNFYSVENFSCVSIKDAYIQLRSL